MFCERLSVAVVSGHVDECVSGRIDNCGSRSYELEEESKRREECAELQQVVCHSHAVLTPVTKRTRVVAVVMNRCCAGAPRHQFSISGRQRFVAGPDLV